MYHIKSVLGQKTQPELIHTLGAPHFKAHCRFLRKLKDFKCALWSEKYGKYLRKLSTDVNVLIVLFSHPLVAAIVPEYDAVDAQQRLLTEVLLPSAAHTAYRHVQNRRKTAQVISTCFFFHLQSYISKSICNDDACCFRGEQLFYILILTWIMSEMHSFKW